MRKVKRRGVESVDWQEKKEKGQRVIKQDRLLCLACVKVEVSSLVSILFSLTFCLPAFIHHSFTSQVIMFTQAVPAISLLSNPLLFFSFFPPLSLSFSCWLEICKACSSVPGAVNPLPKHLSNARNLEMLKKKKKWRQRQQHNCS